MNRLRHLGLFLINFGFFGIAEGLLISDYFGFISDAFWIFRLDVKKKVVNTS